MASTAQVVEDLLVEAGKQGTAARRKVENAVKETVIDLLESNDGRFRGLGKTQTISVVAGTKEYKLNADFNSAKDSFAEFDSDNEFVGRVRVLSKTEVFSRLEEGGPTHVRMGYIEFYESHASGRGYYLILSEEPTEAATYEFDYYRRPTDQDTDIIRNVTILKTGARAKLSEFFPNAEYQLGIYMRMREGFRESPERFVTDIITTPSPRTGNFNQRMHNIGQGR